MSTSLVLGIAGAAVGSMVGMPQLGWVLGSMAGSMYDYSRQHSYGPRLDDLKVTSSAYGTAIPYIIGAPRVAGQVWWASDKREIATDTDVGKGGGPTQTTYTYEIDLLVGLGEGELAGVTRMWQNNKLVFTGLATADDASLMASESADLWRRATFYPGNYTQLPDPTYEAAKGDLALAYRGRACIFFEGLQLGNSGQIPNMTFEACSNLLDSGTIVRRASIASTAGTGLQFRTDGTAGVGSPVILGVTPYVRVGIVSNSVLTVYQFDADGVRQADSTRSGTAELMYPGPRDSWSYAAGVIDGRSLRFQFRNVAVGTFGKKIIPVGLFIGPLADGPTEITTGPDLSDCLPAGQFVHAVTTCSDGLHAMVIGGTVAATGGLTSTLWHIVQRSEGVDTLVRSGTIYTAINDLTFGIAGGHGDQISSFVLENDLLHVWQCTTNTITMWVIGDDGVLRIGSSLTGGAGPDNGSEFYPHPTLWAQDGFCYLISGKSYSRYRRAGTEIQPVTIRRAVEMVCARAGLQSTQFDASPLAAITRPVRGFALGQVGNARGILEQLQTAYQFDVQPGPPLRFVPRGGAAVAAIPYADLGASNEQAQAQPLAIQIASDLELPPRLSLQYLNADDDQQSDTQDSDRLIAGQAAIATLQLGLVLKPAEAKAAADAEAANKLAALTSTQLALSMAYAHLEPADVVEVLDNDGQVYRLRIQRRQDAGGVITLDVVGDDALAPVSAGVTDTDVGGQNVVTALADTLMLPLDIPLLRDQDDGPGYYVAARGATSTWSGAIVLASTNSVDYTQAASVAESAVMGVATTTLGDWTGGPVFDEINSLTVNLAHGEIASSTRDAILADQTTNCLLVGNEIVRFVDATLVSTAPNIYTVRRLLRGQRGTEWASTGHAASERVVLLRTRGMRRVSQQASDIGHALSLKGVTNGQSPASVTPIQFVNTGVSSRPIAPVDARVSRSFGGDITLTWKRRTRYAVTFTGPAGINVPLDAPAEMYDVEVYADGTYSGAQRSSFIGLTSAQCIYPFAAQFAGFGVGGPSTLYAIIYQRIGNLRSYGLRVAIPLSAAPGATSNPIAVAASPAGYIVQTGYTDANNIGHSTYWLASTAAGPYTIAQDVTSEGDLPFFNGSGGFLAQNNTHAASLVPGSLRADGSLSQSLLSVAPLDLSGAPYVVDLSAAIARPRAIIGDGARMLLFGNYNHVYASADGCRTWADLGIMAGATFPNALGSDDFLIQTVRKIGSRWFLIFGRGAPVGTLTTVYYSDDADALTGWTAVFGLDVNAVQSVMDTIVSDGTYLYAVVKNIAETTSSICRSSDGGATWSAEYAASLSAWALQCTGTTGSDKVRVYSSSGAAVEKLVGTTTWAAISSGIVNGFNHIAYGGHLFATDNAPAYSSGGSRIAYETAGAFSTVGGF